MVHVFHSFGFDDSFHLAVERHGTTEQPSWSRFLSHTGGGALSLSSATKLEESVFSAGV